MFIALCWAKPILIFAANLTCVFLIEFVKSFRRNCSGYSSPVEQDSLTMHDPVEAADWAYWKSDICLMDG